MAIKILENQSLAEVIEGKNQDIIIDFYSETCGPCKMLAPVLHDISDELGEKVEIIKVDINKNIELAEEYKIEFVPTLIFMKEGKVNDTKVGFMPKQAILDMLNK